MRNTETIAAIIAQNIEAMNSTPANDNGTALKGQSFCADANAWNAKIWYDKLDACDEFRLIAWQGLSGKTVPSWSEVKEYGLLRTQDEITRARHIEHQLIDIGRA